MSMWNQLARPQGPRAVTTHMLPKLALQESEDLRRWTSEDEVIEILSDPWPLVKHKLRRVLRRWLLRHA